MKAQARHMCVEAEQACIHHVPQQAARRLGSWRIGLPSNLDNATPPPPGGLAGLLCGQT
jgi:hypothetical protein